MVNAFDRVILPYLMVALKKFGFSKDKIVVIQASISDPLITPLINRRPSDFFQSMSSLRQGCTLSPFLYIIMEETLRRAIEKQRRERNITGLQISRDVKSINHSLFTDDTFLLGGASSIISRIFKKVLEDFLHVSWGLLNNTKCRIYGWNTSPIIMQRISQILEIPI